LYNNEIFTDIKIGDKVKGYIKGIREDKRIDVTLQLASERTRGDIGLYRR